MSLFLSHFSTDDLSSHCALSYLQSGQRDFGRQDIIDLFPDSLFSLPLYKDYYIL